MDLTSENLEKLARRRAGAKMGWLIHASVYLLVNAGLLLAATLAGRNWAVFPLLGWGLGLAIHGLAVWMQPFGSQLREALVQRERARLSR